MFLKFLIDPNLLQYWFEFKTAIAFEGNYSHTVVDSRTLVFNWNEGGLDPIIEGIDYHLFADVEFVVRLQGSMCELVDNRDDYFYFLVVFDFE